MTVANANRLMVREESRRDWASAVRMSSTSSVFLAVKAGPSCVTSQITQSRRQDNATGSLLGQNNPIDGKYMSDNNHSEAPAGQNDALLVHYWYILKKRKWVVFSFTAFLMLTVTIATSMATRYYRAPRWWKLVPRHPLFTMSMK